MYNLHPNQINWGKKTQPVPRKQKGSISSSLTVICSAPSTVWESGCWLLDKDKHWFSHFQEVSRGSSQQPATYSRKHSSHSAVNTEAACVQVDRKRHGSVGSTKLHSSSSPDASHKRAARQQLYPHLQHRAGGRMSAVITPVFCLDELGANNWKSHA